MTMQKTAIWILALGILPVSAGALSRMQSSDGSPARPTNAAPLVPVRLNADRNFRIGPPYVADPAFTAKPDVPKGRVIRFTINSAESGLFPTAPAGRPAAGGRGAATGSGPAEPPQHQTFDRQVAVYVPPGYVPNTPAPFIVVQDERWYVPEDAPPGRGRHAPHRPRLHAGDARQPDLREAHPPIVAVLLSPGPGGQRTIEYDTISDRYLNFVETEVLPRITRDYQVAFTADPDGRATFGESSGSPVALNMAWLPPNLYRRVISYSGTFVALQRNAVAPNGAWDYHDIHPQLRAQADPDLAARERQRHRRERLPRKDAQLGHREQSDGRGAQGEGLRLPVRLFRSVRTRRSPRGVADDARGVRVGMEGLQTGRAVVIAHVAAGVQRSVRHLRREQSFEAPSLRRSVQPWHWH